MSKNRTRRLWLEIKWSAPYAGRNEVRDTLIRSIKNGDYEYPQKWRVAIGWANKEEVELNWGEFTKEMKRSRDSSPGFDIAVISYLENLGDAP